MAFMVTVTDKVRLYGLGLGYLGYVAVIVKFKLRLRLGTGECSRRQVFGGECPRFIDRAAIRWGGDDDCGAEGYDRAERRGTRDKIKMQTSCRRQLSVRQSRSRSS